MLSVLDRYILRSLLINYLVALGSMLGLYVALDLFVNMDEFTEQGYPLGTVIANVVSYYWPNLLLYFSQLSAVITLFACLATIARMRKLNELTAVLASGVSLYRLAVPITVFGIATTTLLVIDTELLIPTVAHKLARNHDDVDGARAYAVLFVPDRDGALFSAGQFHPTRRDIHQLLVLTRDETGAVSSTLEADRGVWQPPDVTGQGQGWRLERARRTRRERSRSSDIGPAESKPVDYPTFYPSNLSPEHIQLRQSEGWIRFLSIAQLDDLTRRPGARASTIMRTIHARRTAPVLGLIMLLLGIPFFLNRSPANVLGDAGKCMIVCGLCYVGGFIAQSVQAGSVPSALPTWIPIFVFGTLAIALLDRVKT